MFETETRTDLFGILLTVGQGTTAPQLIALSAPLGVTASNVKSHLSRLTQEGVVRREGPARRAVYSLTERHRPVADAIALRLEGPAAPPWDGGWLSLAVPLPKARNARESLRAKLWFDGFRPWGRETWVRPAWPLPWAADQARRYVESGAWCVQGAVLGTLNIRGIQKLFAVEQLDREAHALSGRLDKRLGAFRSDADAFAARLRFSGQIVDVVARDPLLPAELSPQLSGMARLRASYRALMDKTKARSDAFIARVIEVPGR